ncbi:MULTISPECIES: Asp23/Gls24 family envelope stress response protein [Streptomyces]|uniref:Asp23/Gls24 family envelope stress response protein n=1 Tax=Streptomyces canarius TaxID=285453 RepID=A0ABQ3DDG4_9ACTN|nr:Asp23/Gls24 family envelope stress response protein [Streptomyces canarius]GHA68181.1 hypothetical protein GCM10010345_84840 [Streptomyces canarius]
MALDDPHTRPPEPSGADGPRTGPAADLPPFAGDEVLPCGRLLSRVWERARDTAPTADPHTLSCPHCGEAVEGLATLNAATRALRDDAPGFRALAGRVMNIVRAEIRLGRLLPLADPDRDLRISESAAAKVLRQAADTVRDARVATCRLVPEGDGTDVRVTMTLAAALDAPLPDRIHQVRRSVLRSAVQDLGLSVTAVDITVVDVLEPEPLLPLGGGPS